MDDRIAVAELRGVLHLDGDAADRFDQVFADQRGVPRRAAGDEDDAAGGEEALAMVDHARELHLERLLVDAAADAVDDRPGLLVDLLQHEMGEPALFELRNRQFEFLDVDAALVVVERHDLQRLVPLDDGHLAVVDVDELLRVFDDRSGVGGEEKFAFSDADHHRAALACRDDAVGIALFDDGNGVGADDLFEGLLHRFEQRAGVRRADVLDQIHEHLAVGRAAERIAVLDQRVLQQAEILDDAVVDQGDVLRFGVVRMRVDVVRDAVRGPARVGDADRAGRVFPFEEMFEVRDLAFAFIDVQFARRRHQSHTRAVVAAVFEPMKPFQQDGCRVARTDVSDNSTHIDFDLI